MRFLGLLWALCLFTPSAFAQAPKPTPAPTPAAQDAGQAFCPFEIDLSTIIKKSDTDKIKQYADTIKKNQTGDCAAVGTNIGQILALIDPAKFGPKAKATPAPEEKPKGEESPEGMGGGGGGMTNGEGSGLMGDPGTQTSPTGEPSAETCLTNPTRCSDLLKSLISTYQNNSCSDSKGIGEAIVGLGLQVGAAFGPYGAVTALAGSVVLEIIKLVKNNVGPLGAANKLEKQEKKVILNNLSAVMACSVNDVYLDSVCMPTMYEQILAHCAKIPKARGAAETIVTREDVKRVYRCVVNKESSNCVEKFAVPNAEPGKDAVDVCEDLKKDQKENDKNAKTRFFVNSNELITYLDETKSYHNKNLDDLDNKEGSYERDRITNVLNHCYLGQVPSMLRNKSDKRKAKNLFLRKKSTDVRDYSTSEYFDESCEPLNACVEKINDNKKENFITLEAFSNKDTDGNKMVTEETVCAGIASLDKLEDERSDIVTALKTAAFDKGGKCQIKQSDVVETPQTAPNATQTN